MQVSRLLFGAALHDLCEKRKISLDLTFPLQTLHSDMSVNASGHVSHLIWKH